MPKEANGEFSPITRRWPGESPDVERDAPVGDELNSPEPAAIWAFLPRGVGVALNIGDRGFDHEQVARRCEFELCLTSSRSDWAAFGSSIAGGQVLAIGSSAALPQTPQVRLVTDREAAPEALQRSSRILVRLAPESAVLI
jgi:hypothetical protein